MTLNLKMMTFEFQRARWALAHGTLLLPNACQWATSCNFKLGACHCSAHWHVARHGASHWHDIDSDSINNSTFTGHCQAPCQIELQMIGNLNPIESSAATGSESAVGSLQVLQAVRRVSITTLRLKGSESSCQCNRQ